MPPASVPPPVLKTTTYESVSSFLIAITAVLGAVAGLLWFAVASARIKPEEPAFPVEIVDVAGGGSPEGDVDAPPSDMQVEVPDSVSGEESGPPEGMVQETEVRDVLENVLTTSDASVGRAEQILELEMPRAGVPGGSKSTGRRPLGEGPGNGGGVAREMRWLIRYADESSIDEYSKQLDFFGIELGAVLGSDLVYLSKVSGGQPVVRRVKSGSDEKRLFFTWKGGLRRTADIQLFQRAGVDVSQAILMQFIPGDRELELARLELAAASRDVKLIRRTYFAVRRKERGSGYEFYVTRQVFFEPR